MGGVQTNLSTIWDLMRALTLACAIGSSAAVAYPLETPSTFVVPTKLLTYSWLSSQSHFLYSSE